MLLSECTGRDIWSVEHCRLRRVPKAWIDELTDCFESGFDSDRDTIYVADSVVNQYQGIRDVDLAVKLGEFLGIDTRSIHRDASTPEQFVTTIQQLAEEG